LEEADVGGEPTRRRMGVTLATSSVVVGEAKPVWYAGRFFDMDGVLRGLL
jgi:hypothetical protein